MKTIKVGRKKPRKAQWWVIVHTWNHINVKGPYSCKPEIGNLYPIGQHRGGPVRFTVCKVVDQQRVRLGKDRAIVVEDWDELEQSELRRERAYKELDKVKA